MTGTTTADLSGTVGDELYTLDVEVNASGIGSTRVTQPTPDTWQVTAADLDAGSNTVHAEASGFAADATVNVALPGAGTYAYDANGNRVQFNAADGSVQRYAYDRENRLTTIYYDAFASNPRSEFVYDGLGRRLAVKEYDGQGQLASERGYLYDGLDLVAILDGSGDVLAHVVHGPGIDNPLALVELDAQGAEAGRLYYHADHLGSVRLLTDETGAAARTYDYTAYGVRLDDPGTDATLNPFTYTGREYHAPSGLYFYQSRFLDPNVGQFLSVDQIGLRGGLNVYLYVGANPIHYRDPSGKFFGELLEGILDTLDRHVNPFRRAEEVHGPGPVQPDPTPTPEELDLDDPTAGRLKQYRDALDRSSEYNREIAGQVGAECAALIIGAYFVPPKTLPGFKDARRVRPKTPIRGGSGKMRTRWKSRKGEVLEWDYQHGHVEKYDKHGQHLGSFDPTTGAQVGPSKGYRIEP